jgi:hypothetical protein
MRSATGGILQARRDPERAWAPLSRGGKAVPSYGGGQGM